MKKFIVNSVYNLYDISNIDVPAAKKKIDLL